MQSLHNQHARDRKQQQRSSTPVASPSRPLRPLLRMMRVFEYMRAAARATRGETCMQFQTVMTVAPGWHRRTPPGGRAGISLGVAKPLKCTSERAPAKGPKQARGGGRNGGSEAPDENIYRVKGGVASLFPPGLCEIIFSSAKPLTKPGPRFVELNENGRVGFGFHFPNDSAQ